jgi:glycosyltransferase involved in cell wall biosynthesis
LINKDVDLSVVILTFNEEIHIRRCIESLLPISKSIFVIDSYSTDLTVEICESLGAKVFQRSWKNYSDQFQWGLDNCPIDSKWLMRMDADEYVEADLVREIPIKLRDANESVAGFNIRRKYYFLGQWIRHGAVYPLHLLRIWRVNEGRIEDRWMDEHIVVTSSGSVGDLHGHIVDDNLNSTHWWTQKHNGYADREMIDILNKKYGLFDNGENKEQRHSSLQSMIKRVVKERIYGGLPIFMRPLIYFLYRYFLRLGFLDGVRGFAFHYFQGYWYRSLVDLRVYEVEMSVKNMSSNRERIEKIEEVTGLKLS